MKLQLSIKEFKRYLAESIKNMESIEDLEKIGQLVYDEHTVKYVPLDHGFEVIEED
jgi:hypothetical protein